MARKRTPPPTTAGAVPAEARDQLHPIWRDVDALRAHPVFGRFVDRRTEERLLMGGRVYHHVVGRWAVAADFESDLYPSMVDWRRFNAACGKE